MVVVPHLLGWNRVRSSQSLKVSPDMAESLHVAEKTDEKLATKNKWTTYMFDMYRSRHPPVLGTVDVQKVEDHAREKLKDMPGAFMYVFGSAGTCATDRSNRAAFDRYRLIPQMLRDATERNIETSLFGVKVPAPLLTAPIGVQGILHADAELATARAAARVGVPMILSTASTRSIEDVAQANGDGLRWYQLYWPKTHEITRSILSRARAHGFTTLVVTLDTVVIGWRPHDLDTSYLPFVHGTGVAVGLADPIFMARQGLEPYPPGKHVEFPYDKDALDARLRAGDEEALTRTKLGQAWLGEVNSGLYRTWEDLKLLRDDWDGPIVLKGIQSVADAETAIEYADGIVISNHGGRQVDGAIASLDALDAICSSEKVRAAQRSGKFTVLFDSGIRTGSDIIKAIALGAQAVLLGRPFLYGLALAGEAGVEAQIRTILADFELTLGQVGFKDLEGIWYNRDLISKIP